MLKVNLRGFRSAGLLVCPLLLSSVPAFAQLIERPQQFRHSIEPPKSIISLAPAARPQGELLARHPHDATFEHTLPNYHVFAAASAGVDAGVEVLTLNFAAETGLTHIESKNNDFVLEPGGTCREGSAYSKGDACSLMVRFTPKGPGHRLGFINISHSAEATPMVVGLVGNGYAPILSFTPSQITTVASTYVSGQGIMEGATNLAIDGGDILYVPDIGNGVIREIDSSGAVVTRTPKYSVPASLAADSTGILYSFNVPGSPQYFSVFLPWGPEFADTDSYTPGTCTPAAPCGLEWGLDSPANMSIDANDNLFFEEGTKGAAEMPVSSVSDSGFNFQFWYLAFRLIDAAGAPGAFTVDAGGNLYADYTYTTSNSCLLFEEALNAAESTPALNRLAGGVGCGFSGDGGQARGAEISSSIGQIAIDQAGNVYFTDSGNQRIRRIDAASGIINTIAGTGAAGYTGDGGPATSATLNSPTGIAIDSQGQVYFITWATTDQVLRKINTSGMLTFGSQVQATTSAAKVITMANTGNSPLLLSNYAVTGANPGDFSIASTGTTCSLASGATLTAGQTCKLYVLFKPAATGSRSASLVFYDNTVTSANTILLTGTGITATPAVSLSATKLSYGPETVGSSSASQTVVLTNSGGAALTITSIAITGTNASSFVFSNSCGTSVAAGANCQIHGHFAPTAVGAMTAAITLTDNASGSPQSVALTGSGTAPAVKPVKVTIRSSANPARNCNPVGLIATVQTEGGDVPTGEVEFRDGANLVGSAAIRNGEAWLSISPVRTESMALTANYTGDATHEAATSPVLKQVVHVTSEEKTACRFTIH